MSDFPGLNFSSFIIKGDENTNDVIENCKAGYFEGRGEDGDTPKEMIDTHHKGFGLIVRLLVISKPKEGYILCRMIVNDHKYYFISR